MKRALAAVALLLAALLLSVDATEPLPFAGAPVAVVWSEPARVYASFDASMFAGLEGERVPWNSVTGFQFGESGHAAGWLTLVYDDRIVYAQVVVGRDSGTAYLIVTDSLREFVGDYGGANTWHTRGAWHVNGDAWNAAIDALKALTTE
jgi:hypothetical protein